MRVQLMRLAPFLSGILFFLASCGHHSLPIAPALPQAPNLQPVEGHEARRPHQPWDPPEEPRARAAWGVAQKHSARRVQDIRATLGLTTPSTPSSSVNPFQWTFIGPQPIIYPRGSTTYSGSILSLTLDPHNPNTIYAVTYVGGLWKTTDAGVTWQPLSDFGPLTNVQSVAVDPTQPDKVYVLGGYSGTEEVYESTDGGTTWTTGPPLPFIDNNHDCVITSQSFVVHPARAGTWLFAAACYTYNDNTSYASFVFRSVDSGASWEKVLSINGRGGVSVQFNSGNGNYAYVVSWSSNTNGLNFELSKDGGVTWASANGSAASTFPSLAPYSVSVAALPSDPATVYIEVEEGISQFTQLISLLFKTTDGGATWTSLATFPQDPGFPRTPSLVAVSAQNPNLVFAGGGFLYRSSDGGGTWQNVFPCDPNDTCLHADQHAMVFTPDGTRAYEASDGGVWTTTTQASPKITWTSLNNGLGTAEITRGTSIDPRNLSRGFAGTQDNETLQYSGSLAWSEAGVCGDGFGTEIDPSSPNVVYAVCFGAVFKSTTGGNQGSWVNIQSGLPVLDSRTNPGILLDNATPSVLYLFGPGSLGSNILFQTVDGGNSWHPIGPPFDDGFEGVVAVKVAPSDSNSVYVLSSANSGEPHLWVSTNALAGASSTWIARSLPSRSIISQPVSVTFAVDAADPLHLYMIVVGSNASDFNVYTAVLYSSLDGGTSWKTISPDTGLYGTLDLFIDPDIPNTLYQVTTLGVSRSSDEGASWYPLASGLPSVAVTGLKLHHPSRTLRVATIGRGVWDLSAPTTAPRVNKVSIAGAASGFGYNLMVTGVNFDTSSVVRLNGTSLVTSLANATQLTAAVPTSDLPTPGTYYVAVYEAGSAGGLSDPLPLAYAPASTEISIGSVVNAASFVSGGIVPGEIATIFGTNLTLGTGINLVSNLPLPAVFLNDSVMINGSPVPLFAVDNVNGQQQVNFQVPWSAAGQPTAIISVSNNGAMSSTVNVPVLRAQPGIFSYNAGGRSFGAILHATFDLVDTTHPAIKGETVLIYCTGLGAVSSAPADGAPSSGQQTIVTPSVTIGGVSARVAFSGLAPGFVGLYQINIMIPSGVSSGNQPVVITMGGSSSSSALLPIQ